MEGTLAGTGVTSYAPILNGVTAENIVYHGQAAITSAMGMDGGHLGDGVHDLNRSEQAQIYALQRYNESLKAGTAPPPAWEDIKRRRITQEVNELAALRTEDTGRKLGSPEYEQALRQETARLAEGAIKQRPKGHWCNTKRRLKGKSVP